MRPSDISEREHWMDFAFPSCPVCESKLLEVIPNAKIVFFCGCEYHKMSGCEAGEPTYKCEVGCPRAHAVMVEEFIPRRV